MAAPDIFLSYNREDAARAKSFADAFAQEGFDVWWDAHLRSGEDYDKVTEDALKGAKAVVVLWSPRSVDSRWVRAEATLAHRNKTLMPATIEVCERPIMFELTHTTELSHWHGNTSDPAWQGFVGNLREMIGKPVAQELQSPAPAVPKEAGTKPARNRNLVIAEALAAVLALAAVYYVTFGGFGDGGITSSRSERVQVLVRAFAASGGGNQDEAALASGLTDELINRLRRIPGLQIATALPDGSAPSSAFDGANVVNGSILRNGDQLRVSVRLFKPNGEILWSETYDRTIVDLFEVQEQIASNIADALSVTLDVGVNSVAYGGTSNPEAYVNFVQGKALAYDVDRSRPTAFFERAVALDPGYVKALCTLSIAYGFSRNFVATRREADQLLAKQDAMSARALKLKPDLWFSHAARSLYEMGRGNLLAAEASYHRALDLDPSNDPSAKEILAELAAEFGHIKRATELRRAQALIDPYFSNDPRLIGDLVLMGRLDEAKQRFEALPVEFRQAQPGLNLDAYWAYLLSGDTRKALEIAKSRRVYPVYQMVEDFRFDPEAIPDPRSTDLERWANERTQNGGRVTLILFALLAAHHGHDDAALDYLRLAHRRNGAIGYRFLWHPALAKTRKTEAFAKLITDLGFPEAWEAGKDWGDYCKPEARGGISCS